MSAAATSKQAAPTTEASKGRFEGMDLEQMRVVVTFDAMNTLKAELDRMDHENRALKAKLESQKDTIRKANEIILANKKRKGGADNEENGDSGAEETKKSAKAKKEDAPKKKEKKDKDKEESPKKKDKEKEKEKDDDKSDEEKAKKQKSPPKCKQCGELVKGNDHTKCREKAKADKEKKEKSKDKKDESDST